MPCGLKSSPSECIKVVLRCRPPSAKELSTGYNTCSQEQLYDGTARPLVDAVLGGFNATMLAYGQTGTGKTYTMQGDSGDTERAGVIPRSFQHLFQHIGHSQDRQYLLRASYLEIYQEEIRDLLQAEGRRRLQLRQRPDTGAYVQDLSSRVCRSAGDLLWLMEAGSRNRSVGPTNMNEHSSRSHAIFLITIECSEPGVDGAPHIRSGKLSLVDLAGSERQTKTGATGERLKEATKINLSLSALGNVITALVEGRSAHIPYRDSKLTCLLRDSLGGNAKTVMVANIGPEASHHEETLSTLRYASRAKNITNTPRVNQHPKDALLHQFQSEIARLKAQLRSRLAASGGRCRRRRRRSASGSESSDSEQEQEQRDIQLDVTFIQEEQRGSLLEGDQERQESDGVLEFTDCPPAADADTQQLWDLQLTLQRRQQQEARERDILQRLEEQECSRLGLQETYQSLQQEVDVKTRRLKKLFNRLQKVKRDMTVASGQFTEERGQLQQTQNFLLKQLKLKCLVLEHFVPEQERRQLQERTMLDEESDCWRLTGGSGAARLSAAPTRRTSTFRHRGEDVLRLELDWPQRTTRDYRRSPTVRRCSGDGPLPASAAAVGRHGPLGRGTALPGGQGGTFSDI